MSRLCINVTLHVALHSLICVVIFSKMNRCASVLQESYLSLKEDDETQVKLQRMEANVLGKSDEHEREDHDQHEGAR